MVFLPPDSSAGGGNYPPTTEDCFDYPDDLVKYPGSQQQQYMNGGGHPNEHLAYHVQEQQVVKPLHL